MKKSCILYLLVFALSFQFLTFPVNAVIPGEDTVPTDESMTYDEIVQIAVRAFPEYAHKIQRKTLSEQDYIRLCSDESPSLVVDEMRAVSDTQFVAYQEFSNGLNFVEVVNRSIFAYGAFTSIESETVNAVTGYLLSVHMISCSQQTLEVRGIKCALQPMYYSQIFSYGTIDASDYTMTPNINAVQDQWMGATPAYIEYACSFTYMDDDAGVGVPLFFSFIGILRIDVGPDTVRVSVRT